MLKKLPQLLLTSFLIRLLVTGASVGEALALLALSALCGLSYYFEHNKEDTINEQIKAELEILRNEVKDVKGGLSAVKLGSTYRQVK